MADLQFTQEQVASLAQKLSQVQLEAAERDLLLAIFATAAAQAKLISEVPNTFTLPKAQIMVQAPGPAPDVPLGDLQQQLLNAYIPGNYFDSVNAATDKTMGMRSPAAAQPQNQPADPPVPPQDPPADPAAPPQN